MKIYTRTGDEGETALFGGGRVPKDHVRVEAYGEVDELNSVVGIAVSALRRAGPSPIADHLLLVQEDLFAIGAHLATPSALDGGGAAAHLPDLPIERVAQMESWMDAADATLEPLRTFILPGGSEAAAALHFARTVCRRAERRILSLARDSAIDHRIIMYLNRLSDTLFTFARLANHEHGTGDVPWTGRR